jgi:hypothetical protein
MLVLSLIIVIKENMILKIRCLNGDSATRLDSTRLVSSRVESSRVEPSENICRVESSPARVESSRAESSRIFFDSFRSLMLTLMISMDEDEEFRWGVVTLDEVGRRTPPNNR